MITAALSPLPFVLRAPSVVAGRHQAAGYNAPFLCFDVAPAAALSSSVSALIGGSIYLVRFRQYMYNIHIVFYFYKLQIDL
jgi:hypothetical protein